jgi:hypothetical protein
LRAYAAGFFSAAFFLRFSGDDILAAGAQVSSGRADIQPEE